MSREKTVKSERPYSGRIFGIRIDDVEYPSGSRGVREVVEHTGGAVVVPLLDDGTVLLVRQFRYPLQKEIIELPAGRLNPGEDTQLCAARELEEETGYTAGLLKKLTAIYTTPGFCNEQLHIYVASDLKKSSRGQQLDEGEKGLTVQPFSLEEAVKMIERGEIVDGKTICGILLLERQRQARVPQNSRVSL